MYVIKQSTTTPYNPCGNSICKQFNHTLLFLLKTLPKEKKSEQSSHVPSLVFTYNLMPHSISGYQPYELMFGCKALTIYDAWLGLANYDDGYSRNKSSYMNKQYELIMSANQHALKHIKHRAKQSAAWAGGKPLQRDQPEGKNKIKDSYKSELFIMKSQHQDPNVYIIKPVRGNSVVQKVNQHQLFKLKRSPRDLILWLVSQTSVCKNTNLRRNWPQHPQSVTLRGPDERLGLQVLQQLCQWFIMMTWMAVTLDH